MTSVCRHLAAFYYVNSQLSAIGYVVVESFKAVVPKSVIVAYHKLFHSVLVTQHLLHKLPGSHLCHLRIEVKHHATCYSCLFEQTGFLIGSIEQFGYVGIANHLPRMTTECYHHRRQP